MQTKAGLKYTKDHEWILLNDKLAKVGISDFAQSELGEIVFVDLPSVGKELKAGETLCVVESTKAASDVYAPFSGKVIEVNSTLVSAPDAINNDPYESGWLVKIEASNLAEADKLMDESEYKKLIGQ